MGLDYDQLIKTLHRMWWCIIALEVFVCWFGAWTHNPRLMILGFCMAWGLYFQRWMMQVFGQWPKG